MECGKRKATISQSRSFRTESKCFSYRVTGFLHSSSLSFAVNASTHCTVVWRLHFSSPFLPPNYRILFTRHWNMAPRKCTKMERWRLRNWRVNRCEMWIDADGIVGVYMVDGSIRCVWVWCSCSENECNCMTSVCFQRAENSIFIELSPLSLSSFVRNLKGSYFDGIRSITQKLQSWYYGRPLVSIHVEDDDNFLFSWQFSLISRLRQFSFLIFSLVKRWEMCHTWCQARTTASTMRRANKHDDKLRSWERTLRLISMETYLWRYWRRRRFSALPSKVEQTPNIHCLGL